MLAVPPHMRQGQMRIRHLLHTRANAEIARQIIHRPVMSGHGDTRLLARTAPVTDIVPGSESLHGPKVIAVHFGCVSRHRLSQGENVFSPGSHELQPQPVGRNQFCLLPGKPADIIFPCMAVRVIGMPEIAIVKEAIPSALVALLEIIVNRAVEIILQRPAALRRPVGQTPFTKRPSRLVFFRGGCIDRGLLHAFFKAAQCFFLRESVHRTDDGLAGDSNPFRVSAKVFEPFIARNIAAVIVMPEIHGLRFRRPEPDHRRRFPGAHTVHLESRGIALPEITQAEQCAALFSADGHHAVPVRGMQRGDRTHAGLCALAYLAGLFTGLGKQITVPDRHFLFDLRKQSALVALRIPLHGCAGQLFPLHARAGPRNPGFQQLHRLMKAHAVCHKLHMVVIGRAFKRQNRAQTESLHAVALLVSVKEERVGDLQKIA